MSLLRIIIFLSIYSLQLFAKVNTSKSKLQEINFEEMSINGTIRNPDGAYLVQKKGIKFMPLHELQKNVDKKIRETSLYFD